MSEENKCEACGGEGLVHQGESIHKTCAVCNGTGKASSPEAEVSAPAEVEAAPAENFSNESEEVGATSEGEEETVPV